MKEKCYIIGGGECNCIAVSDDGIIIAADKGLEKLNKLGITPDLIIGDFDSLGYTPSGENVIALPVEKDDTDVSVAIKEGLKKGCKAFFIYGGTGGRPDHTFANYQLLSYVCENGGSGFLIGEGYAATVIKESSLTFEKGREGTISVFSFGEKCSGISLSGLKYELSDAELSKSFPLGVSNCFTGEEAKVSIKKGSLLVMWEETAVNIINYQSSRKFLPFSS